MNLQYRVDLLTRLGAYILSDDSDWSGAKEKAFLENNWFIPEFIEQACSEIARNFLQKEALLNWIRKRAFSRNTRPKTVGIVMAGNIPLVGFHDWLCVFISGHQALIKPSSKDKVLIQHLTGKIKEWSAEAGELTEYADMLKGCDAYIATGSYNSSRYFDFYFGKYPHIIRRNKTSVAVLDGTETREDLEKLGDDVYRYFGLGCRNVTKLYVPEGYDFIPLLRAFDRYNWTADHNKYKNNYDYNLALLILNKKFYMTNGSILLTEDPALFSPISRLNYEFYTDRAALNSSLEKEQDLQCVVGAGRLPFGRSQGPGLEDFADGIDTLAFLETF